MYNIDHIWPNIAECVGRGAHYTSTEVILRIDTHFTKMTQL